MWAAMDDGTSEADIFAIADKVGTVGTVGVGMVGVGMVGVEE